MNINFLEVLYYIMSIIASSGIFYALFKFIGVSDGYEIIFLNPFQRKICKLLFFIQLIIVFILLFGIMFIVGRIAENSYKNSFIINPFVCHMDFALYLITLFCCYDFSDQVYEKIGIIFKSHGKKATFLLKVGICIIATFFSYIFFRIFEYKFFIFQVICLIIFVCAGYDKKIIKLKKSTAKQAKTEIRGNKYFRTTLPLLIVFAVFVFIKFLVIYENDISLNSIANVSEINTQEIQKSLYNYLESKKLQIICLLFVSIVSAVYTTHNRFNIKAILWNENKPWKILHITTDDYAMCALDNFIMSITLPST